MAPTLRSRGAPASSNGTSGGEDAASDAAPAAEAPAATETMEDPKAAKAARRAAKLQAAEDSDPDWPPQKTVWRGVMHQHAAGAALGAGLVLVAGAPGLRAKIGCAIYAGKAPEPP